MIIIYLLQNGSKYCKNCDAGSYQDEDGAKTCKVCEAGSAQANEGQNQCAPCAKGNENWMTFTVFVLYVLLLLDFLVTQTGSQYTTCSRKTKQVHTWPIFPFYTSNPNTVGPQFTGTPIYRTKPFPPSIPVNRGPTVTKSVTH